VCATPRWRYAAPAAPIRHRRALTDARFLRLRAIAPVGTDVATRASVDLADETRPTPSTPQTDTRASDVDLDRLIGCLLGTALGDALGLPFEGLSGARIARRAHRADRFRLVGRVGFVSDDTEQSALVLQALGATSPGGAVRGGRSRRHAPPSLDSAPRSSEGEDPDDACVHAFRRSMIGWFLRLPFGIGGATLRACVRMSFGLRRSGVDSAGNGAAMRMTAFGVGLADDRERRRRLGRRLATTTHTDPRAVQAALYVAELAARLARHASTTSSTERAQLVHHAREVVDTPDLVRALDRALALAEHASLEAAARELGTTGFVPCSLGLCTFVFLRFGHTPLDAIEACIRAGGDTDTHAAIVGGWVGALHGDVWSRALVDALHDGPFGPTHLRALARSTLAHEPPPRWSWVGAWLRNLALYPVVIAHGLRRLVP